MYIGHQDDGQASEHMLMLAHSTPLQHTIYTISSEYGTVMLLGLTHWPSSSLSLKHSQFITWMVIGSQLSLSLYDCCHHPSDYSYCKQSLAQLIFNPIP